MVQEKKEKVCKFCGVDLAKGEFHEEFDYFAHPLVKGQLEALKRKYVMLPSNERLYRMENYAVRRGLRRNATITEKGGQLKPEGGTVVMPGYRRLVEADIWMRKMGGEDVKYIPQEVRKGTELPF